MIRVILSKIVKDSNGNLLGVKITEEEVNDYTDYYKLIGCSTFDVVRLDGADIFLDDEGLLVSGNYGRMVEGYPEQLFGNLVFTGGADDEGETLPCTLSIEDVEKMVGGVEWKTN